MSASSLPTFPVFLVFLGLSTLVAGSTVLAALLVMRTLRAASAALRHAVAFHALILVVFAPLLVAAAPHAPWGAWWRWPGVVERTPRPSPSPIAAAVQRSYPVVSTPLPRPPAYGVAAADSSDAAVGVAATVLVVWALGVAWHLLRIAVGARRVRALLRTGRPGGLRASRDLEDIARELGCRHVPRMLVSDALAIPVCVGFLRPVIVMPSSPLADRTAERDFLTHELAHVVHGDVARGWLQSLAVALHWFNPLVRLLGRKLELLSEQWADDLVLSRGTPPRRYAERLLDLAERTRHGQASRPAIAATGDGRDFEARFAAFLDDTRPRVLRLPPRSRVALLGATLALVVGFTSCRVASLQDELVTPPGPVHVLHVASAPDWEMRYLENTLLRDDELRYRGWLQSAGDDFTQASSPGLEPLASLPDEPEGHDVIIVADADPRTLGALNEKLVDWVRRGGGLVVITGEAHGIEAWRRTELGPLLPSEAAPGAVQRQVKWRWTERGRNSSCFPTQERRDAAWTMFRDARVRAASLRRTRPDAEVWVETADAQEARLIPVVSAREEGQGRILLIDGIDTYAWRYAGSEIHDRFWGAAVRWAGGRLP